MGNNSKKCKICGLPSDIYDLCRQCQEKVNNGEIIKCPCCGSYHLRGQLCACQQQQKEPISFDIDMNTNQQDEEGCFSKAFGGTMGIGCGCMCIILIVLAILGITGLGILGSIFS